MGNIVLSTYLVDNYPDHAMEVILHCSDKRMNRLVPSGGWRNGLISVQMSAFINPWFINDCVVASGM